MSVDTTTESSQRRMKIPALNVVHVCGIVIRAPYGLPSGKRTAGAIFDLSARTYQRGKKGAAVRLTIVCWMPLAETVLARVREGDVLLITGALHNHPSSPSSLQVEASVIQFLTTETGASSQTD